MAACLRWGYAADAGAGSVYRGTELAEAFCDRRKAGPHRVERAADGVEETPLPVRQLAS